MSESQKPKQEASAPSSVVKVRVEFPHGYRAGKKSVMSVDAELDLNKAILSFVVGNKRQWCALNSPFVGGCGER